MGEQIVDIPAASRGFSGGFRVSLPRQSKSQRTAVQIADIPVPGGEGRHAGLHGFLPEQGTTASVAGQTADIPSSGVPRGFLPGQSSTAAGAEQLADILSSGGPRCVLPGQGSTASPGAERGHDAHGHGAVHGSCPVEGSGGGRHGSVPRQSSKARRVDALVPDSTEWVQLSDDKGRTYFWNRRTRATKWKPPPGIRVVWVGERTEWGGIWCWHRGTRVSTFELPQLPPE